MSQRNLRPFFCKPNKKKNLLPASNGQEIPNNDMYSY